MDTDRHAEARDRKRRKGQRMGVDGRSLFTIQRIQEERAEAIERKRGK